MPGSVKHLLSQNVYIIHCHSNIVCSYRNHLHLPHTVPWTGNNLNQEAICTLKPKCRHFNKHVNNTMTDISQLNLFDNTQTSPHTRRTKLTYLLVKCRPTLEISSSVKHLLSKNAYIIHSNQAIRTMKPKMQAH